MKKQLILILLLVFTTIQTYAQLPEKAEDVLPLSIGEVIPEVTLKNPRGEELSTSKILNNKPTIILFYRGGWCPYCNTHLAEIQNVEADILKLGFQIIAISPDAPKNIQVTSEKHKLNYSLYSDGNGNLSKALGIAFKAPNKYFNMLSKKSDGLNEGFLPVPSVFAVDSSGKITYKYVNANYKTRLSSSTLIKNIQKLKNSN